MNRRTYLDPKRPTVYFTMPACPDCGGHKLRCDRAERDADGDSLRWYACLACRGKFNAVGSFSAVSFRQTERASGAVGRTSA